MGTYNLQAEQIEQLYRKMYSVLFIYAQSVLKINALAEEAVQDAFCIACKKQDELFGCGNPEGWIMNTLKYVVQNTVRQREKMGRLVMIALNSQEVMQAAASDEEDVSVLYGDIFEDKNFQMFKAVSLDGRSMREVSDEMGIPIETFKKKIQRTRVRLQRKFSKSV